MTEQELHKRFDYIGPFHEERATVCKDGHWWHVSSDYEPAYEERYQNALCFSEGMAAVFDGLEWFFIRPDGTRAHDQGFDHAKNFRGGTAEVCKGESRFRIRPNGTVVEGTTKPWHRQPMPDLPPNEEAEEAQI